MQTLKTPKWALSLVCLVFLACNANAQSEDTRRLADEFAAVKRQLAEQRAQIEKLRALVEQQQALLNRLAANTPGTAVAGPVEAAATAAALPAQPAPPVPAEGAAAVPAQAGPLPNPPAQTVPTKQEGKYQGEVATEAAPALLSFRIGSAEFTPGGFMDFTSIYRSTNVGGIGTSFGSIPFNNTPAGKLSEERLTIQNSRLTLKVTSKVGKQAVTGYVEADFLGTTPTNLFDTSNSNTLRSRLYFAEIKRGKLDILGGQSWSLMTPGRFGISPYPADLFYTQDMDTNYQVGLTWARQAQLRLVYHPTPRWAAAISFENPQQFIGTGVVLPSPDFAAQLDNGANPNIPNLMPDIIGKVAFDTDKGGRHFHVEGVGLLRAFKVYNPAVDTHFTTAAGGASLNAIAEVVKNFRLVATTFYSDGGGRYIFGLGPDVVVRPNGALSPVRSASGVGGFEYQATRQTMYYGYYGGAYFDRNFSRTNGKFVGFGFPGSPSSANRYIQEATFGVIRTFWKEPRYGALQFISQYSYVVRAPWAPDTAGQSAHTHMMYLDLRYVLP